MIGTLVVLHREEGQNDWHRNSTIERVHNKRHIYGTIHRRNQNDRHIAGTI